MLSFDWVRPKKKGKKAILESRVRNLKTSILGTGHDIPASGETVKSGDQVNRSTNNAQAQTLSLLMMSLKAIAYPGIVHAFGARHHSSCSS